MHRRRTTALVATFLLIASCAFAQQDIYPKKEGIQQPLVVKQLPSWLSFDAELRGRTEEQTSLGYVSGRDRLYELTRVWGGMKVQPANWLTGYLQLAGCTFMPPQTRVSS